MNEPLEIERKFLIRTVPDAFLAENASRRIDIRQIYLLHTPEQGSRRIRHSRTDGEDIYYYNEKLRITDRTRIEREKEITREEFEALLSEADPERSPIEKTRWCVPFAGHVLEIDVFPFWERQCFCEAELSSEGEELLLPEWMEVIREVTEDRAYTNNNLARHIPPEDPTR